MKNVILFQGVLDRFTQIQPKLIFSVNAVVYNGKVHNHMDKLEQVVNGMGITFNIHFVLNLIFACWDFLHKYKCCCIIFQVYQI